MARTAHRQAWAEDDESTRCNWLKEKYEHRRQYRIVACRTSRWSADLGRERRILFGNRAQVCRGYVRRRQGGLAAALPQALPEIGRALGADVKFCPCKTIVPFYRHHVFAEVKPSTRTRIDFGLALGNTPAEGKLIDTGGFKKKDRGITHRLAITNMDDIDAEVKRWLKMAYDRDL